MRRASQLMILAILVILLGALPGAAQEAEPSARGATPAEEAHEEEQAEEAEHEGHSEAEGHGGRPHHKNDAAIFLGFTNEHGHPIEPTLGLDYKRRVAKRWAVGGLFDYAGGDLRNSIVAASVTWLPVGGLTLTAAPGVEFHRGRGATIDWAATATKSFPYMIRQEPGDRNALGRVKFMFPNQYMVYLHDTPSKGLFASSERTFSSGCIRIENPFDLAELLLEGQGWDRKRIDQALASKKTTRVNLENPISVMLLYWTAEADEDGTVFFRRDVYNRDAPIIKGLDEPFRVSLPEGAREVIGYR